MNGNRQTRVRLLLPLLGLLLGLPALLPAVPTEVTYAEGESRVRYHTGREADPAIGDILDTGDSVRTGLDGLVEMDQAGIAIRVQPGTVFAILEREEGGKKAGILSVFLGAIRFRYEKITGQAPRVQTHSCIAGARGTEFTVFSGADGSSLIVVDRGQVTVESEGATVELNPREGVEVQPGAAPGGKFQVQRDQIDYSEWNKEKLSQLLEDPIAAMDRLLERLDFYIRAVEETAVLFQANRKALDEVNERVKQIQSQEGQAAAERYYKETIAPLASETGNMLLNIRYHSLAALSMKRFVTGRIYLELKSRYIVNRDDPLYRAFLDRYGSFISIFEASIIPYIVEADI